MQLRFRSFAAALVGIVVLATATELYLGLARQPTPLKWICFVAAAVALALIGFEAHGPVSVGVSAGAAAIYAIYYTWSAFERYPGLAKDRAPTAMMLLTYVFVCAAVVWAGAFLAGAAARAVGRAVSHRAA